jgi:hypothetical protein
MTIRTYGGWLNRELATPVANLAIDCSIFAGRAVLFLKITPHSMPVRSVLPLSISIIDGETGVLQAAVIYLGLSRWGSGVLQFQGLASLIERRSH